MTLLLLASPACTELEMVTMDWLGSALNLPEEFLFRSKGHGGGVIQVTLQQILYVKEVHIKLCYNYVWVKVFFN